MCQYQPWEDESLQHRHYMRSTGDNIERVDGRWDTQIAMLGARIANVEARVERLEVRMLRLQKRLRVLCVLFFSTLVYAIYK